MMHKYVLGQKVRISNPYCYANNKEGQVCEVNKANKTGGHYYRLFFPDTGTFIYVSESEIVPIC